MIMTALVERLKQFQLPKVDGAWLAVLILLAGIAALDNAQLPRSLQFMAKALLNTAPYIMFAVMAVAYLKASGAEALVARAFEGRQVRMVILASLMGGLSPFCSCEVIPFIAGLLALGTPLAPVMAFWLVLATDGPTGIHHHGRRARLGFRDRQDDDCGRCRIVGRVCNAQPDAGRLVQGQPT